MTTYYISIVLRKKIPNWEKKCFFVVAKSVSRKVVIKKSFSYFSTVFEK